MSNSKKTKYTRPQVAVDCVVFGWNTVDLQVILIQRGIKPKIGKWALPGGFVQENESVEDTVTRELEEETGIGRKHIHPQQLHVFSDPERDKRDIDGEQISIISVAFYACTNIHLHKLQANTDAIDAKWYTLAEIENMDLAFDHKKIIQKAFEKLKELAKYQPIGLKLLPEKFPLRDAQPVFERILEKQFDRRNFQKKMLNLKILKSKGKEKNVARKPAKLFQLDHDAYDKLAERGERFKI